MTSKPPERLVVDANPKSRDWKIDVQNAAQMAYSGSVLLGPITLSITFYFVPPKNHYRTGRNAALLKDAAPAHHTQRPDLTKLTRGTEDAMSGMIWRDDCQVAFQATNKEWVDRFTGKPGAKIAVEMIDGDLFGKDQQ